jgi:hypothetical protein
MNKTTPLKIIQSFMLLFFLSSVEYTYSHPTLLDFIRSSNSQNQEADFYRDIFSKAQDLTEGDKQFLSILPVPTTHPLTGFEQQIKNHDSPFFLVPKTLANKDFYDTLTLAGESQYDLGYIWINTHPTLPRQIEIAMKSIHYDGDCMSRHNIKTAHYNPWNVSLHRPPILNKPKENGSNINNNVLQYQEKIVEYDYFRAQNKDVWDLPVQPSVKQKILDHTLAIYTQIYRNHPDKDRPDFKIKAFFTDPEMAYSYSPTLLFRGDDLNSIDFLALHNRFRSARCTLFGPGTYFTTNLHEADKYATKYMNNAESCHHQVNSVLYSPENRKALPSDPSIQSAYIDESTTKAKWFIISLTLMGISAQYNFTNPSAIPCDTSVSMASTRIIKQYKSTYIVSNKFNSIPLIVVNYQNKKKQN